MDTRLLKDSFAAVAPRADELVEFFYAHLFLQGGREVREMFPPSMTAQRDRLLGALVRTVTGIDDLPATAGYLAALGRDHRKFGADQKWMYDLVGASLLTTLERFAGDAWTPKVAGTWAEAYGVIAGVMLDAAAADEEAGNPPWWDATVTEIDHRSADIAVITARLSHPMHWFAGQSVSVRFGGMPWRFYSPAHALADSRLITFHVRAVPGGMTSAHLVNRAVPGSVMRLGPPVGSFTWDESSSADLVMAAGSTGLAPIKAIIDQLAGLPPDARVPQVHLWYGAKYPDGLYDLKDMENRAAALPWLTLTHAVTALEDQTPGYEGLHGSVAGLITGHLENAVTGRDAYVAGPSAFVTATAARLRELGAARIRTEAFAWEGSING